MQEVLVLKWNTEPHNVFCLEEEIVVTNVIWMPMCANNIIYIIWLYSSRLEWIKNKFPIPGSHGINNHIGVSSD